MSSLREITKDLKVPTRKAIEDAIRSIVIRAEELDDTTGTMFTVRDVRALAWAAQQYLNAPLPKPEVKEVSPKQAAAGAARKAARKNI